jgi:hypothetical protein
MFPSAWQVVKERGFNNVTVEDVVQAGLRIPRSELNPDSIGSVDPDSDAVGKNDPQK